MKTTIKQAHWESNKLGVKMNITTDIFVQKECFIEISSIFLFEIITSNFFRKFKNKKFNLKFTSEEGIFISDTYKLMIYNLMFEYIYENQNDRSNKNISGLFYESKLFQFDNIFLAKQLALINYLKINFKKEQDKFQKLLFNKKDKNNFYIDNHSNANNIYLIVDKFKKI